jgi:hypothetical protein
MAYFVEKPNMPNLDETNTLSVMDDHVETFYSVTGGRGMDSSNPMAITQF